MRRKTDSGRTGDKVDHPDPAAAPLGTDEEAGGSRTPPEDIGESVQEREPGRGDHGRRRRRDS